ncbi:beta-ketoacyl-ACP synthase II [Veillonella magna]|uniref:3-oxoacyl-[acyl-carrier-protein] synthase 2 n=1 Tax=Veillonella magna TaxID=464322 RepID=A0ABS2GEA8_9FIRM|nr:beta-ketoacyl-ACP synthase II [Veillonella magna]MBD8976093.1 beta-ketoacyl-[acyl-carrier-protein] synthase II [Veillonella magna]MBM6823905.1 beta-ketoacyl-ACP synthase II [Veillonella magna]MBM6912045.1 beta-ketoacyl-ACP synthase II [Veillonella magna]
MEKRVVITGLGAVTPVGIGKDAFYEALLAGKSGIGPITHFDASEYATRIAGEVKDFDITNYGVEKKEARRMDRSAEFAIAAAVMALEDSHLDLDEEDRDRCGTVVGTGIGGIDSIHDVYVTLFNKGPARVSPFAVPMMIANMVSGRVSIQLGLRGPAITDVTACASGTNAIGDAFRIVARGDADIMFAGGTEAAVSPGAVAGFASMKAMSTRNDEPELASRPFDAERDGFVMGEGAGIVVLEELEHAKARGAHIYAEVIGYGSNGDAYHITAPAPGGVQARKCMELAIKDAGIDPSEINYINAHGTSTGLNDKNETFAIKELFGDHAKDIAVNSTKSMTGHLLGAAGAIEAIVMAMAIETGKIHPTINLTNPDPELDLDYVPEGARELKVNCALSNSFGFGGHNATLLVRRYED